MPEIGYALSSEEHGPRELVRNARRAEETGFAFVSISDHFHPWIDEQGQSPFVWAVIGGIAEATERLAVGTGVTCPTVRVHPAIVAHAAATAAAMLPGRFFLGVGSGENLNEHIVGARWPQAAVRLQMLEEAIEVMRKLWGGGFVSHHGRHHTVENARLYTLPDEPPPVIVSGLGPRATDLAGRVGDGWWSTGPDAELRKRFEAAGGTGKPTYGQVSVCWAADEASARRTAHRQWPNVGIEGELAQELPLPRHFEQAARMVDEDDVAATIPCGPDPEPYLASLRQYLDAGFDHVYLHQIGPDQEGFFRFYERELAPEVRRLGLTGLN
jgi:coenzyme F420-dependent glucose-6-phosphate dehydrogenase